MTTLGVTAQALLDLYNQGYETRSDFFVIEDAMRNIANYYATYLDMEFQKLRKESKAERGFTNVEIPMSWAIEENVQVEVDADTNEMTARLSQEMFTYRYDSFGYSIVRVTQGKPAERDCTLPPPNTEFIRTTVDEAQFYRLLPVTPKCFYFVGGLDLLIINNVNPVAMRVWYVPSISNLEIEAKLSDSLASMCIEGALKLMREARDGVVLDKSNEGNRNIVMPNEIPRRTT